MYHTNEEANRRALEHCERLEELSIHHQHHRHHHHQHISQATNHIPLNFKHIYNQHYGQVGPINYLNDCYAAALQSSTPPNFNSCYSNAGGHVLHSSPPNHITSSPITDYLIPQPNLPTYSKQHLTSLAELAPSLQAQNSFMTAKYYGNTDKTGRPLVSVGNNSYRPPFATRSDSPGVTSLGPYGLAVTSTSNYLTALPLTGNSIQQQQQQQRVYQPMQDRPWPDQGHPGYHNRLSPESLANGYPSNTVTVQHPNPSAVDYQVVEKQQNSYQASQFSHDWRVHTPPQLADVRGLSASLSITNSHYPSAVYGNLRHMDPRVHQNAFRPMTSASCGVQQLTSMPPAASTTPSPRSTVEGRHSTTLGPNQVSKSVTLVNSDPVGKVEQGFPASKCFYVQVKASTNSTTHLPSEIAQETKSRVCINVDVKSLLEAEELPQQTFKEQAYSLPNNLTRYAAQDLDAANALVGLGMSTNVV